jgi:hypothetical protein
MTFPQMNIDFRLNGVDPNFPRLSRILIGGRFCYMGCANSARRPEKAYRRNLERMIEGRPCRKNIPDGFGLIHRRMFDAFHQGDPILIVLIRNVTIEKKFSQERAEIELRHKEFGDRLLNAHLTSSTQQSEPQR